MSEDKLTHKEKKNKLGYQFSGIPTGLKHEFIAENRKPSQVERLYWILSHGAQKLPSIRRIATVCLCSRYTAKQDLELINKLKPEKKIGHSSATFQPPFGHLSATFQPLQQEQGNEQQANFSHLSATFRPPFGHLSATLQPQEAHSSPVLNYKLLDSRKEKELINLPLPESQKETHQEMIRNLLEKPPGKDLNLKNVSVQAAEIWNQWFSFNPRSRNVTAESMRITKAALKKYGVDDLMLMVRWYFKSGSKDWWIENSHKYLENIFHKKKIDVHFNESQNWHEDGETTKGPKSADLRLLPQNEYNPDHYGEKGHKLPEFGGAIRINGDY